MEWLVYRQNHYSNVFSAFLTTESTLIKKWRSVCLGWPIMKGGITILTKWHDSIILHNQWHDSVDYSLAFADNQY